MATKCGFRAATGIAFAWTALFAASPAAAQEAARPAMPVIRSMRAPALVAPIRATQVETAQVRGKIIPPPTVATEFREPSVTLRAGSNDAVMQSLRITRQYSAAQISENPIVALGPTRLDLSPVLQNPNALSNVAARIRQFPSLAEVTSEDISVVEVDQGLIVRQFLSYRIQPGACAGRASLGRVNIPCFVHVSDGERDAAFSNPGDPHFVADPRARAEAMQQAQAKSAAAQVDFAQKVSGLRAMLASSEQRAQIDADVGPEESARLAALSDDQLTEEMINRGETKLEQVMFVPRVDAVDSAAPGNDESAPDDSADVTIVDTPLPEHVLLTGFTLGRDYEWKQRIEKTIKWCLIDCSTTYYAEIYAGFNYGFGLRFPMRLGGTYHYARRDGSESASIVTQFAPVDASAADYAAAGLESNQLFDGKELVAQVGAYAGMGYSLPAMGGTDVHFAVSKDFTDDLPAPYANGQFQPPAPGQSNLPEMTKTFTDLDLIGGMANFGIVGGQIFPAVKVALSSDKLTFKLTDLRTHTETLLTQSGTEVPLTVDPGNHSSHFSLGDPVYDLSFLVTPGIDARIFLDLAVWSNHWDWPVWFPQLAIQLPPGGAEFGCHAGTVCMHTYTFTPTGYTETAAPPSSSDAFYADMEKWGADFDQRWQSDCPDDTCRTGLNFVRQGTIWSSEHKHDADPAVTLGSLAPSLAEADKQAQTIVNEGQARQTATAANSFGALLQAIWSPRCSDKQCYDDIKGVVGFYALEMNAYQKQHPEMGTHEVLVTVMPKFGPAFQDVIDKSKARADAEAAWQAEHSP
jgi:hypothetical protein